jgi:hypothetical protein
MLIAEMRPSLLVSGRHFLPLAKHSGPGRATALGFRLQEFQIDTLGDHLYIGTTHSGGKKVHDWVVDQIADLFRITH